MLSSTMYNCCKQTVHLLCDYLEVYWVGCYAGKYAAMNMFVYPLFDSRRDQLPMRLTRVRYVTACWSTAGNTDSVWICRYFKQTKFTDRVCDIDRSLISWLVNLLMGRHNWIVLGDSLNQRILKLPIGPTWHREFLGRRHILRLARIRGECLGCDVIARWFTDFCAATYLAVAVLLFAVAFYFVGVSLFEIAGNTWRWILVSRTNAGNSLTFRAGRQQNAS